MFKILIIGGSGCFGSRWIDLSKNNFKITALLNKNKVSEDIEIKEVNLFDSAALRGLLIKAKPDIILNAAAITDVENCEKDFASALRVNSSLVYILSILSSELKIKLIHISTDHIFSGFKNIYNELDTPQPLNNYALTKYIAEEACLLNTNALIIRTNFFGKGTNKKKTFLDFIFEQLNNGIKVYLFDDVFFNPLFVDILCNVVNEIIYKHLDICGILNIASDERLSKFEFGVKFATLNKLNLSLIKRSSIDNHKDLTLRPKNMSLCTNKIKSILDKYKVPSLDEQLILAGSLYI